jgi:hypothetical protein
MFDFMMQQYPDFPFEVRPVIREPSQIEMNLPAVSNGDVIGSGCIGRMGLIQMGYLGHGKSQKSAVAGFEDIPAYVSGQGEPVDTGTIGSAGERF